MISRYKAFLLDPGTIFTFLSGLLLDTAIALSPGAMFSGEGAGGLGDMLYFAVALTVPGILSPVTGALLHELSSIQVIINSARLIAYGPKA